MNKDDLCQENSEPADSKGSAQALPNDQSGPEKSLGLFLAEAHSNAKLDGKSPPECWEAAAQAVAAKVRKDTIEECFHDEQLQVWSGELLADLGAYDYIKDPASYDDVVHMHKVIQDFLSGTVARRIGALLEKKP